MPAWDLRKQYRWAGATASPEYSLVISSAPADSKLKRWTSCVLAHIFVVRGCMSRSHWQLPVSYGIIMESGTEYLYLARCRLSSSIKLQVLTVSFTTDNRHSHNQGRTSGVDPKQTFVTVRDRNLLSANSPKNPVLMACDISTLGWQSIFLSPYWFFDLLRWQGESTIISRVNLRVNMLSQDLPL